MSMRSIFSHGERLVWLIFCLVLLWQTRVILWAAGGLRFIEWKSVALYGTDVVLIGLFLLAFGNGWRPWRNISIPILCFLGLLVASLAWSQSAVLSVAALVRVGEIVLVALYVRDRVLARAGAHESAVALCISALGQAVLATVQYAVQNSTGIRFIGETILDPQMKGVAVFVDHGQRILRAYGTLPHPNLLAFALCGALALVLWHWSQHRNEGVVRWVHVAATAILTLGVWVTFSRAYIVTLASVLVAVAFTQLRRSSVLRWWAATIVAVSLGFCFVQFNHVYTRMALGSSEEAVTLRVVYAHDALLSGSRGINMLGVGAGAYVPWLERAHPGYPWYWYQPTHSIPLLLYTELGLVGVAVVVWVIATLVPRRVTLGVEAQVAVVVICASIGVAMLADHFLWTLQQGRLLIAICLGIMAFCRRG